MEPSYEDVEPEENDWTPETVYRLHDAGLKSMEIAIALGVSNFAIRRHLKARSTGKLKSRKMFHKLRMKRLK